MGQPGHVLAHSSIFHPISAERDVGGQRASITRCEHSCSTAVPTFLFLTAALTSQRDTRPCVTKGKVCGGAASGMPCDCATWQQLGSRLSASSRTSKQLSNPPCNNSPVWKKRSPPSRVSDHTRSSTQPPQANAMCDGTPPFPHHTCERRQYDVQPETSFLDTRLGYFGTSSIKT